jgi:ribose 5-phosphate isomerase B
MMETKIIGLCSDHAGFAMKEYVKSLLVEKGLPYKDFGTYSADSCDYPDFAHPMAAAMEAGDIYPGIAVCGTGNGIGMTLNKHQSIRAAICWENEICRLARAHNDANILVLPGRFVSNEVASQMLDTFLNTPFEGGRHKRRIDKIPVK